MVDERKDGGGANPIGILIADTNKNTRAFYNTALMKTGGFVVWTASTAEDALATLESIPPGNLSVVVFDLTETGLDGHVLLQKIRKRTKFGRVGILIISDALAPEDHFLLREMEVRHFLPKSVGQGDFLQKIREVHHEMLQKSALFDVVKELEEALRNNDIAKCEEVLESVVLKDAMNADSEYAPYRAEVMLLKQQVADAIQFLSDYLHSNAQAGKPETFRALSVFGKALCLSNRYEEAMQVFKKLADKSPSNLAHKVNLGDAMLGAGDVEGAKKQYDAVLARDPENADAAVGEGKVALAEGRSSDAMDLFARINGPIESYSLASFFNNAAVLMVRAGKPQEALTLYQNAMQFFDKYKMLIYFNRGIALLRVGKVEAACECFDFVLRDATTDFIEKKAILKEYRESGVEHMIHKYSGRDNRDLEPD